MDARVLVLGSGQLGLMMAEAAARIGVVVDRLDPRTGEVLPGTSDLRVRLTEVEIAERYPIITVEQERFEEGSLAAALSGWDRCGARDALPLLTDRKTQKKLLERLGIPSAAWRTLDARSDVDEALGEHGSVVAKARRGGYDGRGTWFVNSPEDLPVDKLVGGAILEAAVLFRRELSLVGARNGRGEMVFYPLVHNDHAGGVLRVTTAPATEVLPGAQAEAEGMLGRLMEDLDYRGVMTIELFEADGRLLANEIAPRVHNSGHWTQEGASISQFELAVRALTGLPLPVPQVIRPTTMVNILGTPFDEDWLVRPGHLHWYRKSSKPGRKLGHVNLVGDEAGLADAIDSWRAELPDEWTGPQFS